MEKAEVLELLREKARETASLEEWFRNYGESRLAEYASVMRLINFKVQRLVEVRTKGDLKTEISSLGLSLFSDMGTFRNHQMSRLAELYGVAYDSLLKLQSLIDDYLS